MLHCKFTEANFGAFRFMTLRATRTGYGRCSPPVKVILRNCRFFYRQRLSYTDMLTRTKRVTQTHTQTNFPLHSPNGHPIGIGFFQMIKQVIPDLLYR